MIRFGVLALLLLGATIYGFEWLITGQQRSALIAVACLLLVWLVGTKAPVPYDLLSFDVAPRTLPVDLAGLEEGD